MTSKVEPKADIASPVFTGTPKAPTPGTDADDTQVATVKYVKSFAVGGFVGKYLTSKSGSGSSTLVKLSSYAKYTTVNDCFLCWHCVMDSPGSWSGAYIVLNGQAISSQGTSQRVNYGNDFYFQGPVRAGTTIYLYLDSSKNYHYYSWKAVEFAIE